LATSPTSEAPLATIIGAGPAGLSAAWELSRAGASCEVLEQDSVVGGISRTVNYKGYLFDIGGHRFFTKVAAVENMWREVLGDDLLQRPRLSRIYYKSRFFNYPLDPTNALRNLGMFESARCVASYAKAQLARKLPEDDFATYISNRFGSRLFEIFFRSYTEKVWGIPCTEIRSDWAAQRIAGLDMASLLRNAASRLLPSRGNGRVIKTLIHEFVYPRLGPGMMWERTRDLVEAAGNPVRLHASIDRIEWDGTRIQAVCAGTRRFPVQNLISSMPIRNFFRYLSPAPPEAVLRAAESLAYRDFLIVALIFREQHMFPDNWIYIHDPSVDVGRIQNFKNWSPAMVPDPATTCLGMEYFCFKGDALWSRSDADLIEQAKREIGQVGLGDPAKVFDGHVVRVPKAYPVYDDNYQQALTVIRDFVEQVPNLQFVGRNGMHRYNNQDHSMLSAILAARNLLGGKYSVWDVNVDDEYHEAGGIVTEEELANLQRTQPRVPERLSSR
jgi:protoporphyrinogen oxidase